MRSLTNLALEVYHKIKRQGNTVEENRQIIKEYLLSEIQQWTIKQAKKGNNYFFTPLEFDGTPESPPFEVRLFDSLDLQLHELKFGNLSATDNEERYRWEENDPYRLQKALFLYKVLERVAGMLERGEIEGIAFGPWTMDGLGSERMSYFKNMFNKIDKGRFKMEYKKALNVFVITQK